MPDVHQSQGTIPHQKAVKDELLPTFEPDVTSRLFRSTAKSDQLICWLPKTFCINSTNIQVFLLEISKQNLQRRHKQPRYQRHKDIKSKEGKKT